MLRTAPAAKSLQSCPILCNPIDSSSPGSPVPGILQARTLVWVAISFSNAWKWRVKMKSFSCVWHSVTPWTAAHQAPPSMGFSRQEYWSGVPLPSWRILNLTLMSLWPKGLSACFLTYKRESITASLPLPSDYYEDHMREFCKNARLNLIFRYRKRYF